MNTQVSSKWRPKFVRLRVFGFVETGVLKSESFDTDVFTSRHGFGNLIKLGKFMNFGVKAFIRLRKLRNLYTTRKVQEYIRV